MLFTDPLAQGRSQRRARTHSRRRSVRIRGILTQRTDYGNILHSIQRQQRLALRSGCILQQHQRLFRRGLRQSQTFRQIQCFRRSRLIHVRMFEQAQRNFHA